MLKGAHNTEKVVILCADQHHARWLNGEIPHACCISLSACAHGRLRGMGSPILIDNHALHRLVSDCIEEINKLHRQVDTLVKEKASIQEKLNISTQRSLTLSDKCDSI